MLLVGLVCGAVPLLSGLAVGAGVLRGLAASAVVVTMVTAATAMGDRMAARTLAAAALGVVPLASWIATDGADGVLLSSAVLLGVVALYQEHRPYGAAAASAAMGVGIAAIGPALGVVSSSATLAATRPVAFVGGQLLLLLAAVALHLLWWRFSEADQLVGEASMQEMVAVQRSMLSRMQDTERLKDELLAVVSHEFRTPLTAIIGFSQTLRRSASMGQLPAEMVELSADRIERNGLRLSRLIGNMLAATMDVEPHTERYFPISATIERLVEEFGGDDDGTTEVEVDVPEDRTARRAREHRRLRLGNLVANGMKFADPGTPLRIRGRVAGDEIALVFTNHGPEVPEHMREQIFARFVQVDLSDTRPHDGIGLGLHVVRKLCDAHGGSLELRCQDGLVVLGVTLPAGPARVVGVVGESDEPAVDARTAHHRA